MTQGTRGWDGDMRGSRSNPNRNTGNSENRKQNKKG